MFRLIAIALIPTFLLLALFGTSGEQAPTQRISAIGVMGGLGTELAARRVHAEEAPRQQYVSRHHQPLKIAPEAGASVLRILPYGARVELIDAGHGDFAQVRDASGAVGFIPASSLSNGFPD